MRRIRDEENKSIFNSERIGSFVSDTGVSHYIIYAVPVTRGRNAAPSIPFDPIVPLNQLMVKAVSATLAAKVSEKLPFIVGRFEAENLPDKMVFDGTKEYLDFKPNTHYAFVAVAFTKTKDEIKYRISGISDPPVYIGPDMTKEWIKENMPVAKRFCSIILVTIVSMVIILSIAVFIVVGLAYMKQKQHGSITFDDESDIELFVKKTNQKGSTMNKKAYHKLETDKRSEFQTQTRVDRVKNSSRYNDVEPRPPNLFSISTPPDSPNSHQYSAAGYQSSPLIQSVKENHNLPFQHQQQNPYHPLSTAHEQDRYHHLTASPPPPNATQFFQPSPTTGVGQYIKTPPPTSAADTPHCSPYRYSLPKRTPYTPPKQYRQSEYNRKHSPGKEHPAMKPPDPPPPMTAVRLGIRQGYVMPDDLDNHQVILSDARAMVCRRDVTAASNEKQRRSSIQRVSSLPNKDKGSEAGIVLTSNSAGLCGIKELASDDDDLFHDALSCHHQFHPSHSM